MNYRKRVRWNGGKVGTPDYHRPTYLVEKQIDYNEWEPVMSLSTSLDTEKVVSYLNDITTPKISRTTSTAIGFDIYDDDITISKEKLKEILREVLYEILY